MIARAYYDPGHEARVNALIPEAQLITRTRLKEKSINGGDGLYGARDYQRRLYSPEYGNEFLRIMDDLAVKSGLRVRWPRD